jgi:hypothetical protein
MGSVLATEDSPPIPPMLKDMTRRLTGGSTEEVAAIAGSENRSIWGIVFHCGVCASLGVVGIDVQEGKHIEHE